MDCYRCESTDLILSALWPNERNQYVLANIVLRECQNCGLEQNHVNDDEPLAASEAVKRAPPARRR